MGNRPPLHAEKLRELIEQFGELPPVDGLVPAQLAVILADLSERARAVEHQHPCESSERSRQ
jgi:hypothetical protein